MEKNHVRDCVISVLSKCDLLSEDKLFRVLGILDDIWFLIINRNFEYITVEIK